MCLGEAYNNEQQSHGVKCVGRKLKNSVTYKNGALRPTAAPQPSSDSLATGIDGDAKGVERNDYKSKQSP